MTGSGTRLWVDELDDPTRAMLLGGPRWEERFVHETSVGGLRDTSWDLAPTGTAVIVGRVGHGRSDVDFVRGYLADAVMFSPYEPALPTQAEVITVLENLRKRLELSAETMGTLLGAKVRRYHDWVAGAPMPLARVNAAVGAAAALAAILADDPALAKRIFDSQAEEASHLISTGQFASWKALVDRVRAEQAKEQQAISPVLPVAVVIPEGLTPQAFAEIINSPAFRAGTAILERLAPHTRATAEAWRVEAYAQLEAKLETLAEAEPLADEWVFLTTLTGAGLVEFRKRAEALLADSAATSAAWEKFLTEEGERAWSAYNFHPRDPVEDSEPEPTATGPQGLFDFTNLGLDLVTGEPRKGR